MKLISIGNSKGIRLSKSLIDKYQLENGLNIVEDDGYIKLVPKTKKIRKSWKEFYIKHQQNLDADIEFLELDIENWN